MSACKRNVKGLKMSVCTKRTQRDEREYMNNEEGSKKKKREKSNKIGEKCTVRRGDE